MIEEVAFGPIDCRLTPLEQMADTSSGTHCTHLLKVVHFGNTEW
jgi:hypothetical protein